MKLAAAVELSRRADVVLLFLGLDELAESEGMDRITMKLRDNQVRLLQAVSEANPHVAVVFSGGTPVECPWLSQCQAMVYGGLGWTGRRGSCDRCDHRKSQPLGQIGGNLAAVL